MKWLEAGILRKVLCSLSELAFYFQFKSNEANSWYSLPYYFVALSRLVISILVCKKVLKPFTEVSNTHYLGELNIFKLVQIKYGTVAVWN